MFWQEQLDENRRNFLQGEVGGFAKIPYRGLPLCLAKIPFTSSGFPPLVAVVQAADTGQ